MKKVFFFVSIQGKSFDSRRGGRKNFDKLFTVRRLRNLGDKFAATEEELLTWKLKAAREIFPSSECALELISQECIDGDAN